MMASAGVFTSFILHMARNVDDVMIVTVEAVD